MNFQLNEEDKKDIVKRAYKFALRIIYLIRKLPKDPVSLAIIRQLIKSGTSIGANAEEATAGFSREDFTYKMSIASKEARESNYWLRLIRDSKLAQNSKLNEEIDDAIRESEEIKKILTSIVKTSKETK